MFESRLKKLSRAPPRKFRKSRPKRQHFEYTSSSSDVEEGSAQESAAEESAAPKTKPIKASKAPASDNEAADDVAPRVTRQRKGREVTPEAQVEQDQTEIEEQARHPNRSAVKSQPELLPESEDVGASRKKNGRKSQGESQAVASEPSQAQAEEPVAAESTEIAEAQPAPVPKKRGRKPKAKPLATDEPLRSNDEDGDADKSGQDISKDGAELALARLRRSSVSAPLPPIISSRRPSVAVDGTAANNAVESDTAAPTSEHADSNVEASQTSEVVVPRRRGRWANHQPKPKLKPGEQHGLVRQHVGSPR